MQIIANRGQKTNRCDSVIIFVVLKFISYICTQTNVSYLGVKVVVCLSVE